MRDFWTRTRGLDQQIPALSLNFQFIVEQFVTKHHIKEIHQTQEGMKTILRGVHYPDGHQKLPVRLCEIWRGRICFCAVFESTGRYLTQNFSLYFE